MDEPLMFWRIYSIIKALVKVINVRLSAGDKITEDEVKTAIRAELN